MTEGASIPVDTKASSTASSPSTSTPSDIVYSTSDLDLRSDLKCPDCKSANIHEEGQEVICRGCGHVFEDFIFESAAGREFHPSFAYGLTRVSRVGRPIQQVSKRFHTSLPNQNIESRRTRRAKRFEQIREYLAAAGRQSGLSQNHVSRAYYLWKKAMDYLNLRFWDPAARTAIACLYLAAKESKKGVSLVDLAVRTNVSPYKIGANYKQVKSSLMELKVLAADFSSDEDPWIVLQRILTIGTPDFTQQGYVENLPREIRDVLGINMEVAESAASLRSLLSSAQKCLTIAKDSGLMTGRLPQALGAACLVIAIEVRLVLTVCPEELYEFAARLFGTSAHTVSLRHRELRQSMLTWARRLPFVKGAGKIKESKLVYYMDDVLKYFGHLQEQNRQLWAMLDKDEDSSHDEVGPGGHITAEDLEAEQQMLQDGTFWASDDDDIYDDWGGKQGARSANRNCKSDQDTISSDRAYPPSYVHNLLLEKKQLQYIQEAKLQLNDKSLAHSGKGPGGVARQRIDWIKQLLALGTRTEEEILKATDTALEYWARSDIAKKSSHRSQEQLNSTQLTAEDLDEQELSQYLRNPSDAGAVLRVMGEVYTEVENKAAAASLKPPTRRGPKNKTGQKRKVTASNSQPQQKKVRSSKLNLEALRELGAEEAQEFPGLIIRDEDAEEVRETSGDAEGVEEDPGAGASGHDGYGDSDGEYDDENYDYYDYRDEYNDAYD
ncbi:hypothetical protein BGX21_004519 [Mortierella sp. AD011]|nr:hypothetical protein BGX20_004753 [Mortierella sp. AD010]KAF9400334.1 hypothetical protein BGX21_004519 [Mortierella sp. AD011]